MNEPRYVDGEYFRQHPSWHAEDSAWKARHVIRALERNHLAPRTVCEIGCGAGEVLKQLQQRMAPSCMFQGYEISPQAYRLCEPRANERLHFKLGDFLQDDTHFDLVLLLDLIEHLEDYLTFLRAVRDRGRYKMIHLPLDLSVQMLFRPARLLEIRRLAGHLHYFTEETALQSLRDTGYEIVDSFRTAVALEAAPRVLRTHVANIPRRVLSLFSERLASRFFGGYSLMVLAV
ncbi:MAG: class I SAM-dependent methyltransferase [Sedimentisphaerales bacterium]|nr:class I SAM-dependent methyltransferase [Sedimentisphaerales bacterium]